MVNSNILTYLLVIISAGIARIIPHPPNIAPIGALALYSGARTKKYSRLFLPLGAMFVSDIFLGFHSTMIFVYGSFVITFFIGKKFITSKSRIMIVCASIISSMLFFIITNFGVWLTGSMYPKTVTGLLNAYTLGIPF